METEMEAGTMRDKLSPLPARDLSAGDRAVLFATVQSDGYRILLDIMQRFVIGEETELINTSLENERAITLQFLNVRAAWAMFARMQRVVMDAAMEHGETRVKAPPSHEDVRDRSVEEVLGYE